MSASERRNTSFKSTQKGGVFYERQNDCQKEAIMARFGEGFHNSEANVWQEMDDVQFNQYVGKVYQELSPGFSRMWGGSGMDEGRDGRVRRIL